MGTPLPPHYDTFGRTRGVFSKVILGFWNFRYDFWGVGGDVLRWHSRHVRRKISAHVKNIRILIKKINRADKGGIFKSNHPRILKLPIWLLRGWGDVWRWHSRHVRRKISAHVNGGPSGGSSVRRAGSEDPHRREWKFFINSLKSNWMANSQQKIIYEMI